MTFIIFSVRSLGIGNIDNYSDLLDVGEEIIKRGKIGRLTATVCRRRLNSIKKDLEGLLM